ncbi:SusC/RagA family TonB-linked outer membrane protein [Maribacter cobaltidurans]|uniref:SusC/RagA family TonB-linked outer membrane protein n=1 Tax=Maribacter cobaltidurans TaxID=1178778 RepID=A0A223V4V8_9FLAO|nr:SusC/RagA family TonB-linked outer membrane protein [Maribacter cobaltidurans]ASV30170.1 SusC/RagA family TonB-linked outer membrane protein [Maribacter cobaltidurans]GGD76353.1 SusC/RagA family TonB-linked outer membrane protein [Maribacter cobaltidurans]
MKYIMLVMTLFMTATGFCQNTVSGTVTDAAGNPIPYVNVLLSGTNKGTITNEEGKFSINTTDTKGVLEFSVLGYQTQKVPINDLLYIEVALLESSEQLDEVVLTALGLKRETKELGYVVQSLDAQGVTEVKSVNFLDNLTGKLAGVTISQGPTGVGSTSKITIRGEASFSNNNPLFIVDGVPINNNSVFNFTNEAAAGFQEIDFGNGAMEVNPDDIAEVSVLKGPSAAALYGTRASNGVIVIETKSGRNSTGLGISYNTSFFVDTAFQLPDFQNEYGQGNAGQFAFVDGLGGGTNDLISYSWGPRLDVGNLIPQFDSPVTLPDGTVVRGGDTALYSGLPITPTPFVSHPDNLKDFYRTGTTLINNIAVASNFEKGNYRLSFTDLRSESIIPGVNLDRQTISARLGFRPTEKLSINSSISYINSKSDNRPSNGYGSENVNYSLVGWGPRSLNMESLRDYWQPGLEGVQQYSFNYTYFDNPFFIMYENRNSFNRDRVFGNISASYDITEHLTASIRSGMDYSSELRQLRRAFSSNRFQNGGYAEHDVFYREINTDFLLNYINRFNDVSLDVSVGGNRLDQKAFTSQSQTTSLAQPRIFRLSNAASPVEVFEFESNKRINSFYGLVKLGYKDFLFLDITGRNDWSSALATPFSVDNTSFFYPSVSSSFILSEVVDVPQFISFAKLRASWAQVGNDTNPYQTTSAFVAQTPFNGQPTFSNQNTIANPNLQPEQTSSFEIGADLRFFGDQLHFDISYYNALTKNQIISLPIGISSGYTKQVVNAGSVRSKGLEIITGISPVVSESFSWNSTLNFSTNRAIVEDLPQEDGRLTLAYSRIYDSQNQTVYLQVEEGGRVGDLYGTGYLKNENGDFILTDEGRYIPNNDLQKLGNYNPDFMLGFNNQFKYKNWNLGFLLDWRQGGIIVSRTRALGNVGGQLAETSFRPEAGIVPVGVVNTGTDDNPVYTPNTVAVSAESYYRQFYDRNHEENNTYDASFLKLRQFSIGYTFKDLSVFNQDARLNVSLIGRNLFALTENPHFDPEQLAVQGQGFIGGVEDMSYATTRSIGIKAGFNF